MEQLDLVLQQLTVSAHPLHESLAFEDAAPFHGRLFSPFSDRPDGLLG